MFDCQIVVCCTEKELPWLNVFLRSVKKFWKGSINPIVVLEPECRNKLPSILSELGASVLLRPKHLHPYIHLTADSYVCSPFVLFTDVHELFIRSCELSTFTDHNGRPTLAIERYSTHMDRPRSDQNSICNQRETVDDLYGVMPDYEFTARDPMVFHRSSITRLREAIQNRTRRPLEDLIGNYCPEYFSPLNLLGEYCFDKERSSYDWVPFDQPYESALKAFWGIRDVTRGEDYETVCKILVP